MEKFHHYQVLKREDGALWELGRGAMGITYKAFDTNLRCNVALKVVNSQLTSLDSNTAKMRFIREARAAAALRHPNVASVYHLGNDDQCFFYAMEYIDGITLEALVRRDGPLPCLTALQLTVQVVLALRAAARQELIHRDIKPANLMLVAEEGEEAGNAESGEVGLVKVIDFGLAKSTSLIQEAQTLTAAGSVQGFVGTAQFASPEQLEAGEVDTRSDIYSLGATLWYLLTGRPLFSGAFVAVYSQHLNRPPPLEELAVTPAPVRALLGRMLQKDPADRPQTPSLLKKEIDDCIQAVRASGVNPRETRRSGGSAGKTGLPPLVSVGAGTVLKEKYQIEEFVAETAAGRVFRALDLANRRPVSCLVLSAALTKDAQMLGDIEREAGRIQAAPHPNLVEVAAFGQERGVAFLVAEWAPDFRPLHLLRRRHVLPPGEALWLASHAAAAIDHARAHGIGQLKLDLQQTAFRFSEGLDPAAWSALLDQPLDHWPPFQLKIPALELDALLADKAPGDFAGQTFVPTRRALTYDTRAVGGGLPNPLGLFIYELLGGTIRAAAEGKSFAYVPLTNLREEANDLLRRRLLGEAAFADEEEFVRRLAEASEVELPGGSHGDETRPNGLPKPRPVAAAHRPAQAAGRIIPAEFLAVAQAGAVLKLIPKPGTAAPAAKIGAVTAPALPLHWVARRQICLGRDREQADFVTWFLPRSPENDQRTRRIGRATLRLEAANDRLWAHNLSELNSVLANGRPVVAGQPFEVASDLSTVLLLNGEYTCEVQPFRGMDTPPTPISNWSEWAGAGGGVAAAAVGGTLDAVRLLPVGCPPAFHRLFWLLRRAAFGRSQANPFFLDDLNLGDAQGCCSHHCGVFWIESFLDNNAVCLEKTTLKPGVIAPLASGQTLRLGQAVFEVQIAS